MLWILCQVPVAAREARMEEGGRQGWSLLHISPPLRLACFSLCHFCGHTFRGDLSHGREGAARGICVVRENVGVGVCLDMDMSGGRGSDFTEWCRSARD